MSACVVARMKVFCIPLLDGSDGLGKGIIGLRDHEQMCMIRHQTISYQLDRKAGKR
jgi:hypothetical protein